MVNRLFLAPKHGPVITVHARHQQLDPRQGLRLAALGDNLAAVAGFRVGTGFIVVCAFGTRIAQRMRVNPGCHWGAQDA